MAAAPTAAPAPDADWRATVHYLTYRGLGAAMGHMPLPLAQGVARGVARFMALRGGPALAMNERHMRRGPRERVRGRRGARSGVGAALEPTHLRLLCARTGPTVPVCPTRPRRACAPGGASSKVRSICARPSRCGRGIVMALPHVGSWEWGGCLAGARRHADDRGRGASGAPALFEWFVAQRAAMGLTVVPLGEGSSGALLRALKEGEIAGLVSDRDLVGNGVEVEFFGERTTLPGGAATLALRTGAPLVPVVVYSGPGNWHTGVVHAPVDTARRGSLREDVARVTQALAEVFEEDIRRRPEQWHLYQPNWPSDPTMKVAMLSPLLADAPGGVQGQAMGLARSLRTLGHEVTVLGPADEGMPVPSAVGEHYVIGRPTAVPSNGSVAPVALWPTAAAWCRAVRPRG